jgi:hypothetical protein
MKATPYEEKTSDRAQVSNLLQNAPASDSIGE